MALHRKKKAKKMKVALDEGSEEAEEMEREDKKQMRKRQQKNYS